ncbi:MAG TPA: PPK2 family polyphosphate kinase [Armatimonadaceae bacterium]|nr:PPK2 family polyphosphate kinase [Armatimonadaceae bacterium]
MALRKQDRGQRDGAADRMTFGPGETIDLGTVPTAPPPRGLPPGGERGARERLDRGAKALKKYQDVQMAHGTYGLVVLFEGMDASGKDEAIADALAHLDPRGCEFKHFKTMTAKEAKHDFLWRAAVTMPARGQIGIFNRSYYEQVMGERVHPERLDEQDLPPEAKGDDVWERRCAQINDFERYLTENGIHVLKFFLHVSKEEQRQRLLERIAAPETAWQFSKADIKNRALWDEYRAAFGQAMTLTNTALAPWHVIPADRPWTARAAVAAVIAERLGSFHDGYPEPSEDEAKELEEAREALESDAL